MNLAPDTVREFREGLGVSREWLASELGISTRTVYRWEQKGAHRDTRFMLIGLLVSYGMPIDLLWPE
jgi:transcriptional regulator with XRE-family HTH domain